MTNPPRHETDRSGVILFLTSDAKAAADLEAALTPHGLQLATFADPITAMARFTTEAPALLLFDTRLLSDPADVGALTTCFATDLRSPPPLVVLAHQEDIRLRLAAMRAGAALYLPASHEFDELAERLAHVLGVPRQASDRVLVVDDQPVAALFATRVLQGAGILVERVCNPLEVMQALERFNPDLVLMDLHMPGASGIELTGIIREQDRFADLPIIFLSGELDPEQQMAALRIGGDDFLAKPIAPDRLVEAVRQRLQRSRERMRRLRGPGTIDGLTRLATRDRLLQRLDRLIGQIPAGRLGAEGRNPSAQRALIYLELQGSQEALERLAAEVAARVSEDDLAARVGERAVAILMRREHNLALAEAAQTLTYQVGRALDETVAGVALGAGWYPLVGGCNDSVTLLSRAGRAARWSLRQGERRIEHSAREERGADEVTHESAIREAIQADQLQLLFEPMVALTGIQGERYEMTPRLRLGDGELLPPADFAPIAARTGLAARLDRWLLSAGLDVLKSCLDAGRPVQICIHQSLAGAADEDWAAWVRDQINTRNLIRLRPVVQFEVAEADACLDLAMARAGQLGRLGIRLCLNGLDFSQRSPRVLHALPSAFVRIARRVVQGPEAESIAWLVQSAKACGNRVIATGVDGPESIARLYAAGVELIQGAYVQPPTAQMDFDFAGAEGSDRSRAF